jgi:hypothetical protein
VPVLADPCPGGVNRPRIRQQLPEPARVDAGLRCQPQQQPDVRHVAVARVPGVRDGQPEPVDRFARPCLLGQHDREECRQRAAVLQSAVMLVVQRLLPDAPDGRARVGVHLFKGERAKGGRDEPRPEVGKPGQHAIRVRAMDVVEDRQRERRDRSGSVGHPRMMPRVLSRTCEPGLRDGNLPNRPGARDSRHSIGSPAGMGAGHEIRSKFGETMLWTILVILVALWALGLLTSVGGGFIHLLLVLALIVLVAQFLSGRRATY